MLSLPNDYSTYSSWQAGGKTLCWEKVDGVTTGNRAQQDKKHSRASRGQQEGCGTGLIGNLVLEMPHSDSKRLENRFYPEHHECKILLPGTALTWSRSLLILMKGWEMARWRWCEGKHLESVNKTQQGWGKLAKLYDFSQLLMRREVCNVLASLRNEGRGNRLAQ